MNAPQNKPISPEERKEQVAAFERGRELFRRREFDAAHDAFKACLHREPGNLLIVEALLQNLEAIAERRKPGWMQRWLSPEPRELRNAFTQERWLDVLRLGPDALKALGLLPDLLSVLAESAQALRHHDAELRYWHAALAAAPDDLALAQKAAEGYAAQGAFREARACWTRAAEAGNEHAKACLAILGEFASPDQPKLAQSHLETLAETESGTPPADLAKRLCDQADAWADACRYDAAEILVGRALELASGDWAVREAAESIEVRRKQTQWEIATQLAERTESSLLRELCGLLEEDLNRLELDFYDRRCQRYPDQPQYRGELAKRLRRAAMFFEAAAQFGQYADTQPADSAERIAAQLEQGECLQAVRQFERALKCYLTAIDSQPSPEATPVWERAWERTVTLAEPMGRLPELQDLAQRRVAAGVDNPWRARLDKLGPIDDKG